MKKLTTLICLTLPLYTFANSTSIDLPLSEELNVEKASYTVPLDNLKTNVLYKLSCKLSNVASNQTRMLFEPRLLATATYGDVQLNQVQLPANAGDLQPGNNEFSFRLLINKEDSEQYNRFVLTGDASVQLSQCWASESRPSNSKTLTNTASSGGFFFVTNKTNNPVTIGVGNFFPTEYKVDRCDYRTVFVSTDNQNIEISKVDPSVGAPCR
ncbi:hypothetical protein BN59_01871 [Legionella massiliensis]|uniref:Uncharacterized protein n=1 Tax=Legionella massiliensis TaxID=1034943 RepID=A0A078KX25_9GAMM|nr:hypothetical protein [Legionella massiliensis]CDZ77587.1 hypothetical protein BN59_01871 [Legionella massiliensis]CEE13325.1 hypothetical protein BN1094_01871 [Legionella massiliensis]